MGLGTGKPRPGIKAPKDQRSKGSRRTQDDQRVSAAYHRGDPVLGPPTTKLAYYTEGGRVIFGGRGDGAGD